MSDNLPPGITVADIPGNRDEDLAWDDFFEYVTNDTAELEIDAADALTIWKVGVRQWKRDKGGSNGLR